MSPVDFLFAGYAPEGASECAACPTGEVPDHGPLADEEEGFRAELVCECSGWAASQVCGSLAKNRQTYLIF